jgi:nucleoside-diphosphate-sugar epimerase
VSVRLVTGGSGYFGSVLVTHLAEHGHRVRTFDVNPPDSAPEGVEVVIGDIRDGTAVRSACDGVEIAYHNVAQVPLVKDQTQLRSVNVDGTVNLLSACRDAGVAKVVHTSSSAVYGVPRVNPVTSDAVPEPREPYGHAKLAAEWACLAAVARGQDVTIVRPRTILGHGRLGIFAILFDWIADGADVVVLGDGRNRYQFIHADDLAALCVRAGDRSGPAVFNAGTDRFGTMRETLSSVCAHAGSGSRVKSLPMRPAAFAMRVAAALRIAPFAPYHWLMYGRSMWFDTEPATEQLGWRPRWSNDDMFAQSYDWFIANRSRLADSDHRSVHQRPARQGALRVAKRLTRFLPDAAR